MRWKTIWAGALAVCLLSGCAPQAREPDGLALARVLGADGGGKVTLTAVCGGQDQETLRSSVTGADLDEARNLLPWVGRQEMALTNLSYIIIGEETDLEKVLTYVLADRELSPAATVWGAENAAELLNNCEDPVARLEVLTEQGYEAPGAAEALAELLAAGEVTLPVLTAEGGELNMAGEKRWEGSP